MNKFYEMSPTIGIDLGTTFTCAAVYQERKGPEIIPYENGERIFPSVVYYDYETGTTIVGENAEDEMLKYPANGLFDAKRIIGRKFDDIYVSNYINSNEVPFSIVRGDNDQAVFEITISNKKVKKTPEEVSAEILKHVKNAASVHIGEEITEAVISVPAYFNNAQRKATKKAGELAGLKVLKLVTEPTAAAIHYASDKEKKNMKMLMFDFGGGTLDISIINVKDKQFEVEAVDGDTFLGGRNIDKILFDHFEEKILNEKILPKKVRNGVKKLFFRRLMTACVKIKKKLSTLQKVSDPIACFMGNDEEYIISMSRDEFEDITKEIFERALKIVERCINDSGFPKSDIDEVILVGGSTRIPKVREILSSYFEKTLNIDVHPDESVAAGASIQAAVIKNTFHDLERYKITDVTPLTLGIERFGGVMTIFIPKNSKLPYRTKKTMVTSVNNQFSTNIKVFEGERKIVKYNNLLGMFTITGFPQKRAGDVKFNICFKLDEDGILNVTASEQQSMIKKNLVITMDEFRLSPRQIKLYKEEAKKHKYEDDIFETFMSTKSRIYSNCQHILYDIEKLSDKDRKFVQQCCDSLQTDVSNLEYTEVDKLEAKYVLFISSVDDILKKNCMMQIDF